MSEVEKFHAADDFTGELCVLATDFDAEHALRLEAERQVGELREQLEVLQKEIARKTHAYQTERALRTEDRARLDTAMGLLRDLMGAAEEVGGMYDKPGLENLYATRQKVRAALNTPSTEGKDHE